MTVQLKKKRQKIPVACYDASGRLVSVFPTIQAAARSRNVEGAGITRCIRPTRTHFLLDNLFWRKAEETIPEMITVPGNAIPMPKSTAKKKISVACYDAEGKFVCSYPNISAAAAAIGVSSPNLIRVLRRDYYKSAKMYWRKVEGTIPERIEIPLSRREEKRIARETDVTALQIKQDRVENSIIVQLVKKTSVPTGLEFSSCAAAAEAMGISRQMIHLAVSGKSPSAAGFSWTYKKLRAPA